MRKVITTILIVLGLALVSRAAFSQWPDRSVQMIVPFPAGGLIDVVARKLAEPLSVQLGKPVVVVNRDGASGIIGTGAVAASKDGHTIGLVTTGPLVIQPLLRSDMAYETGSLKPICQIFTHTYVVAVRPDSPYNTLKDLLQVAREPEKVSLAFLGPGAAQHFVLLQLSEATGAQFLSVPYRGDPPVALALKSGVVDSAILTDGVAHSQGFKILAVASERRHPSFKDVPTMTEQGVRVVNVTYTGLVAPASMSQDASRTLENACAHIMQSAEFQATLKQLNISADYLDRPQFESKVRADVGAKRQLIQSSGMKLE